MLLGWTIVAVVTLCLPCFDFSSSNTHTLFLRIYATIICARAQSTCDGKSTSTSTAAVLSMWRDLEKSFGHSTLLSRVGPRFFMGTRTDFETRPISTAFVTSPVALPGPRNYYSLYHTIRYQTMTYLQKPPPLRTISTTSTLACTVHNLLVPLIFSSGGFWLDLEAFISLYPIAQPFLFFLFSFVLFVCFSVFGFLGGGGMLEMDLVIVWSAVLGLGRLRWVS